MAFDFKFGQDRDSAPGGGLRLRLKKNAALTGEVRDPAALGFVVAVRVVRLMVLWIVVFFVDRAYQESYVQRVLVDDGPASAGDGGGGLQDRDAGGSPPPRLWTLPAAALAIEAGVVLLMSSVLFLLNARFKAPNNAFVVDAPLFRRLAADYAATTAVIAAVGTAAAAVAQDARLFRYRDDGLRGIRAFCTMFVLIAFAVLLLTPFF